MKNKNENASTVISMADGRSHRTSLPPAEVKAKLDQCIRESDPFYVLLDHENPIHATYAVILVVAHITSIEGPE